MDDGRRWDDAGCSGGYFRVGGGRGIVRWERRRERTHRRASVHQPRHDLLRARRGVWRRGVAGRLQLGVLHYLLRERKAVRRRGPQPQRGVPVRRRPQDLGLRGGRSRIAPTRMLRGRVEARRVARLLLRLGGGPPKDVVKGQPQRSGEGPHLVGKHADEAKLDARHPDRIDALYVGEIGELLLGEPKFFTAFLDPVPDAPSTNEWIFHLGVLCIF